MHVAGIAPTSHSSYEVILLKYETCIAELVFLHNPRNTLNRRCASKLRFWNVISSIRSMVRSLGVAPRSVSITVLFCCHYKRNWYFILLQKRFDLSSIWKLYQPFHIQCNLSILHNRVVKTNQSFISDKIYKERFVC